MSDWTVLAPLIIWPALALIAIILLLRAYWEPTRLDCTTVRIDLPNFGSSGQAFRILLFSDLHAEYFRIRPDRLLAACAASRADLVVFAGDLSGRSSHLPAALSLMSKIRQLPELKNCPFFAVRGNHDTDEAAAGLTQLGVTMLENAGQSFDVRGERFFFIGLQDLRTARPDIGPALKQAEAAGIPPERRLVAAHNPDTLLQLPNGAAAVFLAGHFHGGQIWLPFHLEFLLLRSEKLPRIGHYKGLFTWEGTHAYISRGLGCVSIPLRLFSRPELTVLEISSGDGR